MDPPTTPFPFFRLPLLVQVLILKLLNLGEVFDFALLSNRSRAVVRSAELKVSRMSWNLWSGNRNYYKLVIRKHHVGPTFELEIKVPIESREKKENETININDAVLPISRRFYAGETEMDIGEEKKGTEYYLNLMEQLTKIVLDIFTAKNLHVTLTGFSNILSCFVWKYADRFHTVSLNPCCYTRSPRYLYSDDLKHILKTFNVKNFEQDGPISYFTYSGPLRMRYLALQSGYFLGLNSLLQMKCRHLWIRSDSISDQKINGMIKAWLSGTGLKNFESFQMTVSPDEPSYGRSDRRIPLQRRRQRLENIVKDIETLPLDLERWTDRSSEQTVEGYDLRRGDGMQARVAFTTDCLTCFQFRVHRERGDPDLVDYSDEEDDEEYESEVEEESDEEDEEDEETRDEGSEEDSDEGSEDDSRENQADEDDTDKPVTDASEQEDNRLLPDGFEKS